MASFTADGQTEVVLFDKAGEAFDVDISGTYDQTIELQREIKFNSGIYETVKRWDTANATVNEDDFYVTRDNERWRLAVVGVGGTPGTATATITAQKTYANDNLYKGPNVETITAATFVMNDGHAGKRIDLNRAAGIAVTLPASTGSGNKYRFYIKTAITSNTTTIKAASAADSFVGMAFGVDDDVEGATGYQWNAETNDDTVTMSGTATGGKKGDYWEFEDVETGVYRVVGYLTQSGGAEATPFSATVS